VWAHKILSLPWNEFLSDWNSQDVLVGSSGSERLEIQFSKERLCAGLEGLSLAAQIPNYSALRLARDRITWVVGEQDRRYMALYGHLKAEGVIEDLAVIKNSGHRVLFDNPKAL